LWRARLFPDERARLAGFLAKFPVSSLKDRYVDDEVFDGIQITFDLQIGSSPARQIFLGNGRERNLDALVRELNLIMPPDLRIQSRQN
jgi:hypothetical protein